MDGYLAVSTMIDNSVDDILASKGKYQELSWFVWALNDDTAGGSRLVHGPICRLRCGSGRQIIWEIESARYKRDRCDLSNGCAFCFTMARL